MCPYQRVICCLRASVAIGSRRVMIGWRTVMKAMHAYKQTD